MGGRPRAVADGLVKLDRDFWRGRRVLLTGHTGFKGAWMTMLLHRLGASVTGFSLPEPVSEPSLFAVGRLHEFCRHLSGDVRDLSAIEAALAQARAEVLVHMAAQPIVRAGVHDPLATFDINVMGVAKVLDAARRADGLKAVLIVTSDKCYENREQVWPYREDEPMGGSDPYSASKGAAELVTAAYARTYFQDRAGQSIVSVRAGNVLGGGDWAADRLIPDLVRAAVAHRPVEVRSPSAVRPWQHVLDPLNGYLLAAQRAADGGAPRPHEAWNFGPSPGEELSVREVVDVFRQAWTGSLDVRFAVEGEAEVRRHREAGLLRVDSTKAKAELGWRPALANEAAVRAAAAWYGAFMENPDATDVRAQSLSQIENVLDL